MEKFILSEEHNQARVGFANKMLTIGSDFYSRIRWSDKCKITLTPVGI
jgi:hypothetical protein